MLEKYCKSNKKSDYLVQVLWALKVGFQFAQYIGFLGVKIEGGGQLVN